MIFTRKLKARLKECPWKDFAKQADMLDFIHPGQWPSSAQKGSFEAPSKGNWFSYPRLFKFWERMNPVLDSRRSCFSIMHDALNAKTPVGDFLKVSTEDARCTTQNQSLQFWVNKCSLISQASKKFFCIASSNYAFSTMLSIIFMIADSGIQ